MIQSMIIAFRESLEILIVIISLMAYLTKVNRKSLSKYLYIGGIAGLIVSSLCAIFLYTQINSLTGFPKQFFEGGMMLFVALLILYNIIWIGNQNKNKDIPIDEKYKFSMTGASLFLLTFLTVFRECLEIVMFILPIINNNVASITLGLACGVALAFIVGYFIYKAVSWLKVDVIFTVLNILLIFIGAAMFGEGLGAFFPLNKNSMELTGKIIFGLPLLYVFSKSEIKKYTKKTK